MHIIFDFDHTIFNMSNMHDDLRQKVCSLGVSENDYQKYYDDVTRWKMFNLKAFSHKIEMHCSVKKQDVERAFLTVASQANYYMYEDVFDILPKLKDHHLYILSWGDFDWQDKKIESSGILPHVKKAFSINDMKSSVIKQTCEDIRKVVLVDDRPAEISGVLAVYPHLHCIRMRRANGKYSEQETPKGVHEVKDMHQLHEYLSQLNFSNAKE